jgi:hypothetical protein
VEDFALFLPKFDIIAFQKKILELVDRQRSGFCYKLVFFSVHGASCVK